MSNDASDWIALSSWIIPVVLAILLHEIAHGLAALYFGDTTAKDNNRLSLNPIRHVDLMGTIIFPLFLIVTKSPFLFGWAKPVPVDFSKLRNPKRDMIWVSLAGPATNFVLALIALAVLSFYKHILDTVPSFWTMSVLMNMVIFNFSIMIFNLLPILPMDGGRILTGLLPLPLAVRFAKTEKCGFLVIVSLLIFLPILGDYINKDLDFISWFLSVCVHGLFRFFTDLFGLVG